MESRNLFESRNSLYRTEPKIHLFATKENDNIPLCRTRIPIKSELLTRNEKDVNCSKCLKIINKK